MSRIGKKDVSLLLNAGFSVEDLGLAEGGMQGVEIYETPDDYFAHELIENACEQGLCSLQDEITAPDEAHFKEHMDTSHKGIYDDQEYAGNEDYLESVPHDCREQVLWLNTIKLGKMTVWQRKNKKGEFEWLVKNLTVEIPEEEQERYKKMSKEYQKELWVSYARDEWKKLWESCAVSLRYFPIEEKKVFKTKYGQDLNLLVISADNIRKLGYNSLPPEARWITMVYFNKEERKW